MKMRPPAIPLITVDPYFSVWSPADKLYDTDTVHWTGSPNTIRGYITVDGETYRFMGGAASEDEKTACQLSFDMNAMVSCYGFRAGNVGLTARFYTPLFLDSVCCLTRPVSYLRLSVISLDGEKHETSVRILASEELCLDRKGQSGVLTKEFPIGDSLNAVSIGNAEQNILSRCGDDLRIDWGYFYMAVENGGTFVTESDSMTFIGVERGIDTDEDVTILFAYDDIKCLDYFGFSAEAVWKADGKTIEDVISEAYNERDELLGKCGDFSKRLENEAEELGGKKYAELLALAYRQSIAAHKLAYDENGEIIFISKECFSNGCAATVDVTYPSSPLYLCYNTELLKGMLRPIFKFAASDRWSYDFAPHDAGTYPFVTGQVYGLHDGELREDRQMPVEECGNMLIMMANISLLDGNTDFADKYSETLSDWVRYLIKYGADPANQLCTDDFAGHLAHNCNLSLKAIMGIAGYSLILQMKGKDAEADTFMGIAREMAKSWVERAANADGSFRLAFDKPGTFSMKYNIIWDDLWGTGLFPSYVVNSEFLSNFRHFNAYGMPLDSRKTYTKSDWLVWSASMATQKEEFERYIEPLWHAYDSTESRVPMTDWYDTVTAKMIGFRHRSVQGGLFIKLLGERLSNI